MEPASDKENKTSGGVRILLAEAAPGEVQMYARELVAIEPQFHIATAATLSEVLAILKQEQPDILLLDFGLPGGPGLEGLRQVQNASPETPAIVLAGRAEKDLAQRALEQGAHDFLIKGQIDHRTVLRAIQCTLWRRREALSQHPHGLDDLTGLFSLPGFARMAAQHFHQAQKSGGTLVLLRVDVDSLAAIRHACGPANEHRVLLAIAELLQKSFRRTDLLGRVGEDAFAALLIDAIEPSAPILRQRIERRLEALNQSAHQPPISLSIGALFWNAAKGGTLEELSHGAEADLQRIKEEKRRAQRLPANPALEPADKKNSEISQPPPGNALAGPEQRKK